MYGTDLRYARAPVYVLLMFTQPEREYRETDQKERVCYTATWTEWKIPDPNYTMHLCQEFGEGRVATMKNKQRAIVEQGADEVEQDDKTLCRVIRNQKKRSALLSTCLLLLPMLCGALMPEHQHEFVKTATFLDGDTVASPRKDSEIIMVNLVDQANLVDP